MRRGKTSRCGAWSVAHTQLALAAVITAWERNAGEEMACVCLLIRGTERKVLMCMCLCLELCGKGGLGGCPGAPNPSLWPLSCPQLSCPRQRVATLFSNIQRESSALLLRHPLPPKFSCLKTQDRGVLLTHLNTLCFL